MSSSLYWRPPPPDGDDSLGSEMKFALRDYCTQGTGGYIDDWTTLGTSDVQFLRGLIAGAGKDSELGKDAQELIDKIEVYGSIQVKEQS